ncbi:5-demethoxyubiquinone hydroxylase, mitochondrial [Orchesella cincta]|uniref:5-demethoxyubiquinone hydroxylase, mitochondrial n=1 Tax=Orchesella cincta TaxID=48709 RepID=A0A1D2N4B8_ORCCI|nr:5-demethoxyubiquinone hydroxylase, mitochondrial [Orchesella cincta]
MSLKICQSCQVSRKLLKQQHKLSEYVAATTLPRRYYTNLKDERLKQIRDRMIRVDHAGEYGANRIYAGQMAVLGQTKSGPLIQHMWDQEKEHLRIFETLMPKYRARPTVLLPIWNVAGFALGAGTALLGERAAMACTVAVESAITDHYNNQIRELMASSPDLSENKELLDYIQKCRDEEQEHHDTGIEHEAEKAPAYNALTNFIKGGCKAAIWLSERI